MIIEIFKIDKADADYYMLEVMIKRFDTHFVAKCNVKIECYKLFTRKQRESERVALKCISVKSECRMQCLLPASKSEVSIPQFSRNSNSISSE